LGDGGAVTTSDESLARRLRLLGNLGSLTKYDHETKGLNSRLDTLQAAVLSVKFRHLAAWNNARRMIAAWYRESMSDCPGISLPTEALWTGLHAYHLFVVRLTEQDRDKVTGKLMDRGVQAAVHYPIPVHLQKAYADLGACEGAFPNAELAAKTILSLPIFPEITRFQIERVSKALCAAVAG